MYDLYARELIQTAPHFGDIDFNQLPKDFTKAYTLIVSARLCHQNLQNGINTDTEELLTLQKEISKIAYTFEAYVVLQSKRSNGQAAAFISASAYTLLAEMEKITNETSEYSDNPLTDYGISFKLSAALLYFQANYTADAIEMVKKIESDGNSLSIIGLMKALRQLLTGNISLINENQPVYPATEDWSLTTTSDTLWAYLHEGVNTLLRTLTHEIQDTTTGFEIAQSIFSNVIEISSSNENINIQDISISFQQTYVGEKYLATMLKNVTRFLPDIALITLNVPSNTNTEDWYSLLSSFSKKRPYLWPNHLGAIHSGYLNEGISSVISFPTGGGKSTLSELKIATSLLRRESVIFIAPTLALVDQVSKSLKETFPSVRTSVSFDEFSGGTIELEELPDISVMTPESCLVKMSFSPELFSNIGLFIFDECHLLHSKNEEHVDRRSLDAMFCLLKIIELSPSVDLLLMSAMLSNSDEIAEWLSTLLNRQVIPLTLSWKPTRQAKGCVVYNAHETSSMERYIRSEAPRR